MSSLERTRVFTAPELDNLCQKAVLLLDTATQAGKALDKQLQNLDSLYGQIPAGYRENGLYQAIYALPGSNAYPAYEEVKDLFQTALHKLSNQIPECDRQAKASIQEITQATQAITCNIKELEGMIKGGALSLTMEKYAQTLTQCKKQWEETKLTIEEKMAQADFLKGIVESTAYHGDPVNMSTGNFIHTHTDLTAKGAVPLTFTRSYNAMDKRKGILGRGWVHNYEEKLEFIKEGKIKRITADGREEIYQPEEKGIYQETRKGILTIKEEKDQYHLQEKDREIHYHKNGKMDFLENKEGSRIQFRYDQEERLERVKTGTGETLLYIYDEQGKLHQVKDHMGREITFTYQSKKLEKVTHPDGQTITYHYGENNRISHICNQKNQTVIQNTYDQYRRIIKQTFPDGGETTYEYQEAMGAVIVTEPNGNRITYYHDNRMRHIKTQYEDGQEVKTYDDRDRIVEKKDKNGRTTTYQYDTRGNLTKVTDPKGNHTTYTYTPAGEVQTIRYPDGGEKKTAYDPYGRPLEITNQEGETTTITYTEHTENTHNTHNTHIEIQHAGQTLVKAIQDIRGNILTLETPETGPISYEYDTLRRVTASHDAKGRATRFLYDTKDRITMVTRADDASRHYQYSETGKVIKITDFDGHTAHWEYNCTDQPGAYTDKNGNRTTYEYDLMQNITKITDPKGAVTAYTYNRLNRLEEIRDAHENRTTFRYDPEGNRTGITYPDGTTITYTYDELNRKTSQTDQEQNTTTYTYDAMGNLTALTDPKGHATTYQYDKLGNKTQETDPIMGTTTYTYTPLGNIQTITDPAGRTTTHTYHPGGQPAAIHHPNGTKETYDYDEVGNLIRYTDQKGIHYTYQHDCLNRITQIRKGDREALFTYDALGNVAAATDYNGHTTTYHYTPTGKLRQVTDAMGNQTVYTYDKQDNLISMLSKGYGQTMEETAPLEHLTCQRNLLGQIETITDGSGLRETYRYDNCGRIIQKTGKEGKKTTYRYTPKGNLCEAAYPDGRSVRYTYDALSLLTRVTDWLGTTQIEYDPKGRPIKATDIHNQETAYQWGTMGEKKAITYPDGITITYQYDAALRLKAIQGADTQITYRYHPCGRIKEKKLGDTLRTLYTYHQDGRLEQLTHLTGKEIIENSRYRYDPMGNPTAITLQREGMPEESGEYTYTYDPLNRLTHVEKDGNTLRQYQYDPHGNRTGLTEMIPGGKEIHTRCTYNPLNQLVRSQTTERKADQTGTETSQLTTYTYTPAGNLETITRDGRQKAAYTYGIGNLPETEHLEDTTICHQYDGLGQRKQTLKYQKGSQIPTTTRYLTDLTSPTGRLLEQQTHQKKQTYLWDDHLLAIMEQREIPPGQTKDDVGKETYYSLPDERHSPLRILDREGRTKNRYSYDEYGRETTSQETIPQPFGYTGYRGEETKGSYHGGARIYQAGTGTFTAKDDNRYINPLNPRTLNLYQYCQGNPMAYTDPTGHEALMEGSQIAGLILYCPESLEKTYLERTLECLLLNNFSQEVTGAGIGIKVGLGVAGLDLPFDIVNIIADLCQYDDPKYKTRQDWWGNFALDVLAFAPLIGLAKYAKYLTDAKAVFKPVMKKAGEIGEIIRSTGRKISGVDDVGEAGAKQLDGGVRVAKEGGAQGAGNLNIDDTQFGKKIGKHAQDYNLDPADPNARNILKDKISDIFGNPTEIRQGEWMGLGEKLLGGGNAPGQARFYVQGNDVVITDLEGNFVSIMKDGINNLRVKVATTIWP